VNKILKVIGVLTVSCQMIVAYGQDIPVGTWRLHVSYFDVHSIAVAPDKIFAAAANGIMIVDLSDESVSTLTKLDGLSSINITHVAFDQTRNQLLITYADGDIDIVRDREIINFNTLRNATTISGSKRINHVSVLGDLAYLSTDFGVVAFDLIQLAVKETWRDLGAGGTKLKVKQSTFYSDSIFLATEKGVLAGKLTDNLLDFNNWKRFETGSFNGPVQSITTFDGRVYAAINGSGIYNHENSTWSLQSYLQSMQYSVIAGGHNLLVATQGLLFRVTTAGVATAVTSELISGANVAFESANGKLWIGDAGSGLISDYSGLFSVYTANGPTFSNGFRLRYSDHDDFMYAVSGGFSSSLAPLGKNEYVNFFSDGVWRAQVDVLNHDVTSALVNQSSLYVASCGYGLQIIQPSGTTLYDESNSPLQSTTSGRNVRVTDIVVSDQGVWVTNAGAAQPLHLLKKDNTWESFSFPTVSAARYPTNMEVDYLGNVWMLLNPANGGGVLVFNKTTGQSVHLTNAANSGGLPSRDVYSIAMDRDGFVWLGTNEGVAYFPDPSAVFRSGVNAVKPVFGNRFLLRDERVTAIEVDGGNRKWMGTEKGLWLFDEFGEKQIYNFNAKNSPLLSDKIVDLEIIDRKGELFIVTDAGMASFRSDATTGEAAFRDVKIFPNPVTNQFNGLVGISGLVTDAVVKITDVSGKLVWQTTANGGTAAWNVRDYRGSRAATGIYLVFCITQDGTESMVGKIAVVN
jgi:Two component regulator propeller